jgi:hypothetical protein
VICSLSRTRNVEIDGQDVVWALADQYDLVRGAAAAMWTDGNITMTPRRANEGRQLNFTGSGTYQGSEDIMNMVRRFMGQVPAPPCVPTP